jgi:hypothetical protein
MLFPMKRVMEQYQPFIVMMHDDVLQNNTTTKNLKLELIFGLHAILPLLDYMFTLIKFPQSRNVFVCDFIDVVKIYQLKLYWLYSDPYNKFDNLHLMSQRFLKLSLAKINQRIGV